MLETLDAAAVRHWCVSGLAALRLHQHEIDELNVYPVPDGDTGTNLVLTLTSAHEALSLPSSAAIPPVGLVADGPEPGLPESGVVEPGVAESGVPEPRVPEPGGTMRRMARGALLGARGNSGVIVSQILRGMADTFLASPVAVRGAELARALRTASEAAYAAVARPVEGTVLSVVAAAAEGAGRIASDDLVAVARAAARSAAEALARTPQQLPVLAAAGVVDAGGRGLVLLLEALVETLSGAPSAAIETAAPTSPAVSFSSAAAGLSAEASAAAEPSSAGPSSAGPSSAGPSSAGPSSSADSGYEVQYLLDAPAGAVAELRRTLDALGNSLVVVGTGEGEPPTWNVHVHVNDIGAAIEAGVQAGRPYRISVTRLADRVEAAHHHRGAGEPPGRDPDGRGAVVVAAGEGLTALFAAEGAVVVGRNPSTAEMLTAIDATGAGNVVLLPNDANTLAVAGSAAREAASAGVRVSVVPTRSPVQALAALAVRDTGRDFADDVIAMAEAAGACRYGEVCTAAREALTVAGRCRPGDLLGLVDGEVHVIGHDLDEVCRRLLDRMLGGGGELATLVLGADAPPTLQPTLTAHVGQTWPFVEVQCYSGGQPRYHLLVGVE